MKPIKPKSTRSPRTSRHGPSSASTHWLPATAQKVIDFVRMLFEESRANDRHRLQMLKDTARVIAEHQKKHGANPQLTAGALKLAFIMVYCRKMLRAMRWKKPLPSREIHGSHDKDQ